MSRSKDSFGRARKRIGRTVLGMREQMKAMGTKRTTRMDRALVVLETERGRSERDRRE